MHFGPERRYVVRPMNCRIEGSLQFDLGVVLFKKDSEKECGPYKLSECRNNVFEFHIGKERHTVHFFM